MPSIFFGINIARRSLQATQKAMDVTSQNIANANTPGYSRQEAVLTTGIPYTLPFLHLGTGAGQLGSGVEIEKVVRSRDQFLDQQIRSETNNLGLLTGQSEVLQRVETAFLEPSEHGISNLLDEFWNGWQELSKNPEDLSMRTNLVEKAVTLTQGINQIYGHLEYVYEGIDQRVQEIEKEIANLVDSIDYLDKQIIRIKTSGQEPNDLMDRRDLMLEELAKYTDFTMSGNENGGIDLTIKPAQGERKGELGGLLVAKEDLGNYLSKVNDLANQLINSINDISVNGNNIQFFQPIEDEAIAAKQIRVSNEVISDPSKLTTGVGDNQDGQYALAVAQLRHEKTMDNGEATFEESWQNLVVGVGSKTKEALRRQENQEVLMSHLKNRRDEISGVSIDEELVNMVKFQYAFQASSKMITTLDEMLDTIINRMGR